MKMYSKENYKRYREKNKDKIKAYYEAYYEKNKDKIKAYHEAYYEAYYEKNKDKIKACHEAYYEKNKDKIKACHEAYREKNKDKEEYKKVQSELARRYRLKYPEKIKAQRQANNHFKSNKNQICVFCGQLKVEKHHPDYSKPLEVIFLCRKCHIKLHRGEICVQPIPN